MGIEVGAEEDDDGLAVMVFLLVLDVFLLGFRKYQIVVRKVLLPGFMQSYQGNYLA